MKNIIFISLLLFITIGNISNAGAQGSTSEPTFDFEIYTSIRDSDIYTLCDNKKTNLIDIDCVRSFYSSEIILEQKKLREKLNAGDIFFQRVDSFIEENGRTQNELDALIDKIRDTQNGLYYGKDDKKLMIADYLLKKTRNAYYIESFEYENKLKVFIEAHEKLDVFSLDEVAIESIFTHYLVKIDLIKLKGFTESSFINYGGNDYIYGENNEKVDDFLESLPVIRDSVTESTLKQLPAYLEVYLADNSEYPTVETIYSQSMLDFLYKGKFPEDPLKGYSKNGCVFGYKYQVSKDKKSYRLSACMEGKNYINNTLENSNGGFDPKNSSKPVFLNKFENLGEYKTSESFNDILASEQRDFYYSVFSNKFLELNPDFGKSTN